jgi:hypothetical protein
MTGFGPERQFAAPPPYSHAESKKTQKFAFRSALGPNQISFSHSQGPQRKYAAVQHGVPIVLDRVVQEHDAAAGGYLSERHRPPLQSRRRRMAVP